ncbi:chromosomal replication initiator protein DnaA [Desulfobacterales bacterium HSG16]|nr:chromosomal replication initiator protein DnaA [Desulfobacterales bacterium HSG16]
MEESIWEKVKIAIKGSIPNHSFRMWIEPLKFKMDKDNAIILECPNFFSRKRVVDHYAKMIESEISRLCGMKTRIDFTISGVKTRAKKAVRPKEELQLELPTINMQPALGRILRKNFTFDRFVVGGNNDFAYSASLSLANRKLENQSSLFLLSKTGMGKSHLSQAIGHHILSESPAESVNYITAEDFTNEMVNAFKSNEIELFKEKYRNNCDVLLLEDVHFLTGKERTQIELALALDYLFDADKKIIFTSCYLPSDIPKMNEQLCSRLAGGLITTIEPPDFRTRIDILNMKLRETGCPVPGKIMEYLAEELADNVRQLESGLIGVTTRASLLGERINMDLARSVVQNIGRKKQTITIDLIKKVVCINYNVTIEELMSKSRKKSIVRPRHVAIYLSRKYTNHTYNAIGKHFNRYHATAIRSIGAIEKGIRTDNTIRKQVEYCCRKIEEAVE